MGKHEKIKSDVLSGTANANIRFEDLCGILRRVGFVERIKGSHRVFSKPGIPEIINLQEGDSGKSKPYQVRQVAGLIKKYGL